MNASPICASCGVAIGPDEESYSITQDAKVLYEHPACLARELGCTVEALPGLAFPERSEANDI